MKSTSRHRRGDSRKSSKSTPSLLNTPGFFCVTITVSKYMDKKIALTHEVYHEKDCDDSDVGFDYIYRVVGEYTTAKEVKLHCVFQNQ
jgi:hypothetical protein